MILYHGSGIAVSHPDLRHSRADVDFGAGFYLIEDRDMAYKWASNKTTSIVNVYDVDVDELHIKQFDLNEEWLRFIIANRLYGGDGAVDYSMYDALYGPIADDRLYDTLGFFESGIYTTNQTLRILNCMDYVHQFVFTNEFALTNHLRFVQAFTLTEEEKTRYRKMYINDRKTAREKTLAEVQKIREENEQLEVVKNNSMKGPGE